MFAPQYGTVIFTLRQLRLVRHSLSKEAAHALVRAMVHCRLDYCNSVLANQPMYVYSNLQSVLRTAARLVMRLPGYASVTEVMKKDLHWLGFPQRISYKVCTLTYKCLHAWHGSGILGKAFHSCFFSRWMLTFEVCCRWSSRRSNHENKNNWNKKLPLFGTCSLEQSTLTIAWLFSDLWKFQKTTENLLKRAPMWCFSLIGAFSTNVCIIIIIIIIITYNI